MTYNQSLEAAREYWAKNRGPSPLLRLKAGIHEITVVPTGKGANTWEVVAHDRERDEITTSATVDILGDAIELAAKLTHLGSAYEPSLRELLEVTKQRDELIRVERELRKALREAGGDGNVVV